MLTAQLNSFHTTVVTTPRDYLNVLVSTGNNIQRRIEPYLKLSQSLTPVGRAWIDHNERLHEAHHKRALISTAFDVQNVVRSGQKKSCGMLQREGNTGEAENDVIRATLPLEIDRLHHNTFDKTIMQHFFKPLSNNYFFAACFTVRALIILYHGICSSQPTQHLPGNE